MEKMRNKKNKKSFRLPKVITLNKVYNVITYLIQYILIGVFVYALIIVSVGSLIPAMAAVWGNMFGVTYNTEIADMIVLWVIPNLFTAGLLFIADVIIIKKIHNSICRYFCKLRKNYENRNVQNDLDIN